MEYSDDLDESDIEIGEDALEYLNYEYPTESQQHQILNILNHEFIKVDEKFIIEITKQNQKSLDKEAKRNCKILKFPFEWTLDEVFVKVKKLNHKEFLNLFVFIIESQFGEAHLDATIDRFVKCINKPTNDRPLVLQMTSIDENVTKIFYKEENSRKFYEIKKQEEIAENFETFLGFLKTSEIENFETVMLEKLPKVQNSSLIIRILRTLKLSDNFFKKLILKCAERGSKTDLLASINANFGNLLCFEAQEYLSDVIYEETMSNEELIVPNQENSSLNEIPDTSSDNNPEEVPTYDTKSTSSEYSSASTASHLNPSILQEAIKNSNKEVISYLISYCSHLIQQLSFKHKVRISTTAFETNQIDVLCDLIEISDFPFPENIVDIANNHKRLANIIKTRNEFEIAINTENFDKISKFIDNASNLRLAYNVYNISAMKHSINHKKYNVYFHLKSFGFQASEFSDLSEILNENELKKANKIKVQQRKSNVIDGIKNVQNSVMLLCTRSIIHNRKIKKELEHEYHAKIKKWYEDIYKIEYGPELLAVAASCDQLMIIFDFESYSVENASLEGPNSFGSTYPISKWIFMGAKLSDKARDQEIKGVLAHELCHYVMRLVYENDENPYYKHMIEVKKLFEAISIKIDQWSADDSVCPDDECFGIISTVYQCYSEEEFHLELIVRVVQSYAQFDNDGEKLKHLEEKYKELFEFFRIHVLPDLRVFNLKNREDVRKSNRIFEVLSDIKSKNIKLSELKNIEQLVDKELVIIITNIPMLLLINIHSYLCEKLGDLFDTKNIFIDPEKLKNSEILNDFKKILTQYQNLNVFINSSEIIEVDSTNLVDQNSNFIFITSNESQSSSLQENLPGISINPIKVTINYNWNDLTSATQKLLMKTKIIFQNSTKFSFFDLLKSENDSVDRADELIAEEESRILERFSHIVNDQLLNLLLNNHQIVINTKLEGEKPETYFEILFHPRQFAKEKSYGVPRILQQQLLLDVKNHKYILISDIAGSGKSWVMKNLTNTLRQQFPSKWVTYVDLKLFIHEFKAISIELEFSEFMADTILYPKNKFEGKFFKQLYSIGKVIILFDAFDEIAPDCAEIVSKLAVSFATNGGNQLWIATRDYFEVNLQNKLQIETAYKLYEFTEENGIKLISKMWLLNDLKDKSTIKSEDDFKKFEAQLSSYEVIARRMIEKVSILYSRSIGLPQLFKMIADAFINNKNMELESKKSKIYEKFAHNLYERWSYEKGIIRKNASIESQSKVLNFWTFHQLSALKSYFPDMAKEFDGHSWVDEEIIACGLMSKKGGKLFFLHETFREFFSADFIAKNLMMPNVDERVIELFSGVLTDEKMEVIRMFLNDIIDDYAVFDKLVPQMQNYIKKFYKMENFHEFFTKNLENLGKFIIAVLKHGEYEEVKNIISQSALKIASDTKNPKLFSMLKEFLFDFLEVEDLKDLVIQQGILQGIVGSSMNVEVFDEFATELSAKIGESSVSEALKSISKQKGNIFPCLCWSPNFDADKVHECLRIMSKYLNSTEMLALMKKCNNDGKSILHICVRTKNIEKLTIFWMEIESFFEAQNSTKSFNELVTQKNSTRRNILHYSVECDKIEFHEELWKFLLKLFNNRQDLKNFILLTDNRKNNYVHDLVENSKNQYIIESIFNIFRDNFNETEFQEIFKPKGRFQRNLLQTAAFGSKGLEIQKILWKILRNVNKSDKEFFEVLKEVDGTGESLILNTVKCSSSDVLEFLIEELENVATHDEIRELLSNLDRYRQNLLQAAVWRNKSWKLHIILWTTFRKYFNETEMKQFVAHVNNYGSNLLSYAVRFNTLEFTESTWNEIKSFMTHDEIVEYLKVKRYDGTNLAERSLANKGNPGVHEWIKKLMIEYGIDDKDEQLENV
ncbi:uncharacterized protein [Chironomus tepperi]|uniref:uncharacterized protein n=1 Tax=Chironomus tepperi TaxID=113505 RepID=UPI00391FC194